MEVRVERVAERDVEVGMEDVGGITVSIGVG
jgi:hypothetical protein